MFDSPHVSLVDIVAIHARFRGGRTALICGDRAIDWRGLYDNIDRAAAAFALAGVAAGDRVALLLPNCIAAVEAMLGVLRCGGVIVPLSAFLKPDALAAMIDDSGAKLFVSAGALQPLARAAAGLTTGLDALVGLDFSGEGWVPLAEVAEGAPPLRPLVIGAGAAMNIIYSSGTTGVPKGIVHSHQTRIHGALGLGMEFRIDSASVTLLATPLYTNGTWMTWLPTLIAGGTCVILERYTAEDFLDAVAAHGGSHAFLVPTQIRGILDAQARSPRDLSSLRMIVSAGSPMPRPWKEEALGVFGGRLMELYGLTEGIGTTLRPEDMLAKPDSVGTPIGATDIRILTDDDRIAPAGEIGEIVGYGAGLMIGYHNRPAATEEAIWRDERGRTFLRTGDIGRFDEDGFLYILDRKKDMIVSGGVNVFAIDIEQVLHAHPQVADVAVVGAPHAKWVEAPVAVVLPAAGAAPDPETLRAWATQRLAKHQQIDRVVLRTDDFPRNALGKVLKRELRAALA
jgi:acyl-CoA synthetase (AMP-forming)/AMP-acid ligase II